MTARPGGRRRAMLRTAVSGLAGLVLAGGWANPVAGQDLTPRAYWPAPKGTKVAIVGYSHVRGDVLFDPSIPLSGVDSKIHTGLAAYLQTFNLCGRTANIVVDLPYSWGTTQGLLEMDAGLWWFTDNDDFLTGTREQEPIYNFQAHLIRRFSPGFWASLDANYFVGGRQTVGGDELGQVLHNARVGGMIVVPFGGRHAVKAGYFIGARTSFGNDFDQLLVTYQVLFR
jgi:hypothetical protein